MQPHFKNRKNHTHQRSWIKVICSVASLGMALTLSWSAHALHDYPALGTWLQSSESSTASVDHSAWQRVLDKTLSQNAEGIHVVDYALLAARDKNTLSEELATYLTELANINIRNYTRNEQFAYWVNLYNALTVQLIAEHYPVKTIKQVHGGWFNSGPWDEPVFTVQGKTLSLNDIEHRILRPIWRDHRIHFVVNCASIGCPNLQPFALTAANVEPALEQAAREFLQHRRGFEIQGNSLRLSKIFQWYRSDFGANEQELIETLTPYLSAEQKTALPAPDARVRYQYDWALNDKQ